MGSVFQHWAAHSSTFIFDSCLLTLVASRRRLFRSTTIRWSLRTLGVLSSSVIKASTRDSGGYTPFTLEQESRKLRKKVESSGASSRSSSTETGPIFQAAHDGSCPNQTTHVQGTHDYAYLLALLRPTVARAKASSFWASCSCWVSWWKLFPRPPLRNPTLVCASKTR